MKRLIARFLLAADTRKMTPPFHNRIRKVCPLVAATLIIPALAISFALPTFAQQEDVADPQTTQKVFASFKGFVQARNNHDAAAIAAYYTRDAVFVTPDGPIIGREAIQKWLIKDRDCR